MYNSWGGTLEVDSVHEDDQSRSMDLDRAALQKLEETQQSWLLGAGEKKKKQYVDLGCVTCSRKLFMGFVYAFAFIALIIGLTVLIVKTAPKHKHRAAPPDNYTVALHKALRFFNAQKSGILPKSNNISYRGNSALKDGSDISKDLVGGYYDAGDNIKFTFPQAYAMTLLSWSVIEYSNKYEAVGELTHVKELIKWGLDYLLKTFNSTAPFNDTLSIVDNVVIQVGLGVTPGDLTGSPNDHYCWQRPEDMSYARPAQKVGAGSDVGAELAAALAAGSIVFKDNNAYSRRLVNAAQNVFKWSRDRRAKYSADGLESATFYNSSGYYDEYLWGGTWLYYATGNSKYLQLVTTYGIGRHAGAYWGGPYYGVFSWDNKLIGAQVLLTRLRIMQNPGYPYEDVLKNFNNHTNIVMCSYLPYYQRFRYTPGGLAILDQGNVSHLQYTVSAAFLATLYADYMVAADVAGWYCGPTFYPAKRIKQWAQSQIDYILGKNPLKMSYVVGFGKNYPKQVHHRAASIPKGQRPSCTGGWAWRNKKAPNPNVLEGALVGGPDARDHFHDARQFWNFTEPTIAGNAALIGTLIGLSGIDSGKDTGVDTTTIFSAIPPQFPASPPPSPPWSP